MRDENRGQAGRAWRQTSADVMYTRPESVHATAVQSARNRNPSNILRTF